MKTSRQYLRPLLFVAVFVVLGVFISPQVSLAASITDWNENFDSYTVGDILPQGGWTCPPTACVFNVTTSKYFSSPNSLRNQSSISSRTLIRDTSFDVLGQGYSHVYFSFYTYFDGTVTNRVSFQPESSTSTPEFRVDVGTGLGGDTTKVIVYKNVSPTQFATSTVSLVPNTWYNVVADLDTANHQVRIRVGSEPWTSYVPTDHVVNLTKEQFTFVNTDTNHYIDEVLVTSYEPPTGLNVTTIYSMLPAAGSTVATSSAVSYGAVGYVASADYVSGAYLHAVFQHQSSLITSNISLAGWNPFLNGSTPTACIAGVFGFCLISIGGGSVSASLDIPITSSGNFSVSTSSQLFVDQGRYVSTYSIKVPTVIFGLTVPFADQTLVSTTTYFIMGAKSYGDSVYDTIASTSAAVANSTSWADAQSYCNPLSGFDVQRCLYALFIPSAEDWRAAMQSLYLTAGGKWPLGYVTRPLAILNSSAQVALPNLTFTLPTNANLPGGVGGSVINLTPWGKLMGNGSYVGSTTSAGSNPQTFRDIVEPNWKFFVYFCFGMVLVLEIIGLLGRIGVGGGVSGAFSEKRRERDDRMRAQGRQQAYNDLPKK